MTRTTTIFWCAGSATALLLATSAVADLVVLYDSGQSWPIDRYLAPIVTNRVNRPETRQWRPEPGLGPANPKVLLPIRSPGLSPGTIATRAFDSPTPVAFFMIGSDAESLRWLIRNRDTLKRQGAIGLLVDAGDERDLNAVANAADGLPIIPASGDDIARALAISYYPVAVTDGRIWQ